MKKLTMSLLLALTTSLSFSQTATKTASPQNEDSIICLPKKIVGYMVKDLIKYDAGKEQIKLLTDSIYIQNTKLSTQASVLGQYQNKMYSYESTIREYEMIDASNQKTIEALNNKNKRYKKQRNLFKILLGASLMYITISSY
jgi:hypothetical protein